MATHYFHLRDGADELLNPRGIRPRSELRRRGLHHPGKSALKDLGFSPAAV